MTIVASAKGLTVTTLDGSPAKTFPCDLTTIQVVSDEANIWTIKDVHGAGLNITDQDPHYLAVMNRGFKTVKITKIGTPITPIQVPVHGLTIVNQAKAPMVVVVSDNHSTHTMDRIDKPMTFICPFVTSSGKIVNSNYGSFSVRTDLGTSTGVRPAPAR